MINSKSIEVLKRAQWTPHFKRPVYDSYSFSLIPQTIEKILTGTSEGSMPVDTVGKRWELYDCVVLFIIDGFGWEFFEKYCDKLPFLNRFNHEGIASKISAQFPTTTAAHITTINTGLEVGLTGIYEWFYYEPKVKELIAPLLFSYAGDHEPNRLAKDHFTARQLFPFETFYQKLHKKGVKSKVVQSEGIAHSPYSRALTAGAEIIPYTRWVDGLEKVKTLCETPNKEPTYISIYFADIDAQGHRKGIDSEQFKNCVEYCWNAIETHLFQKIRPSKKTALLFTADHGMSPVIPKETVYLNRLMPSLVDALKETGSGKKCVPAGSCRDFFLHCKEECLEEVQKTLQEKLMGKADVVRVDALLKDHFFGQYKPSKRLKDRVGNLVVLPYYKEAVWWFEKHRFEQHFYAAHGGLTSAEIDSLFLFSGL